MDLLKKENLHYWPRIACVWLITACILPYIIAINNDHLQPFVPFISDCGALPPESCVFGQMFNIGAGLAAILVYIRYRQTIIVIDCTKITLSKRWNELGLWFGICFCVGLTLVANFQETNVLSIHIIGGLMAFVGIGIYLLIQTRISFSLSQIDSRYEIYKVSKSVLYIRTVLTFLYLAFLAIGCIYTSTILLDLLAADNLLKWSKADSFYEARIAIGLLEWFMIFTFALYVLAMTKDFKSVEIDGIHFKCKNTVGKEKSKKTN